MGCTGYAKCTDPKWHKKRAGTCVTDALEMHVH